MMTVSEESEFRAVGRTKKNILDDVTLGNCDQQFFFFIDKLNESANC